MEQINRVYNMLSSGDEELQDLGIALTPHMLPEHWGFVDKKDHVAHCIRILAYRAYGLGFEEGKKITKNTNND